MQTTTLEAPKASPQPVHYATGKIARLVAKVSPANRPALEAHIEYARGQKQVSENGVYSFARPVAHADAILGKPFLDVRGEDCLRLVSVFRTVYSPQSLRIRVVNFRMHLRWLYDTNDLEKAEALGKEGRAMERALKVRREKPLQVGQVIQDAHLDHLLASLPQRSSIAPAFPMEVRDRCIFACLRAFGHRGGEFVSLNLHGLHREDTPAGPLYRVALDDDAPDLKTGPRTIYVQDPRAVKALDDWLAVHPFRHLTPARPGWQHGVPLFINGWAGRDVGTGQDAMKRLTTAGLRKLLRKAVAWAGLTKAYPAPLTPHDFRHTCATEKARLGWNEYQLCAYFGWIIGSRAPTVYVHLTLDDQRARVLQDAQRAVQAAVAMPQATGVLEALAALVRQAMGGDGAAPAPLVTIGGAPGGTAPAQAVGVAT